MYQVDEKDRVVKLDVWSPSIGAPGPELLAREGRLALMYWAEECDREATNPETDDGMVGVLVKFDSPYAHFFGPPNDEARSGHPLGQRGLDGYDAVEVKNSSWIRSVEAMNSVHPKHSPSRFDRLRHFIFPLHDSTFECLSAGIDFEILRESREAVRMRMAQVVWRRGMPRAWSRS